MEEGMICEKCWNSASGKQGDRAVPEFDLKIGTKDIEVYGGGYYTPGAELRHPWQNGPQGNPQSRPYPSWLAWPILTPLEEGPVDYTLSTSLHAALIA